MATNRCGSCSTTARSHNSLQRSLVSPRTGVTSKLITWFRSQFSRTVGKRHLRPFAQLKITTDADIRKQLCRQTTLPTQSHPRAGIWLRPLRLEFTNPRVKFASRGRSRAATVINSRLQGSLYSICAWAVGDYNFFVYAPAATAAGFPDSWRQSGDTLAKGRCGRKNQHPDGRRPAGQAAHL